MSTTVDLRCLSVRQPWAWAIIHGPKRIENRSRPTNYRGQLLIHAAKAVDRLGDYGNGEPAKSELVFGAIIGIVDLIDCVSVEEVKSQPFAEGPFCWILDNVRAFTPFPCSGSLSLWKPPADFPVERYQTVTPHADGSDRRTQSRR